MHKHITHNRCHKTFADFSEVILMLLARRYRGSGTPTAMPCRTISVSSRPRNFGFWGERSIVKGERLEKRALVQGKNFMRASTLVQVAVMAMALLSPPYQV